MLKLKGSNNRQIIDHKSVDKISINIIMYSLRYNGSAQLTGEAPGLQIRCGALKPSRVGSIPMHFRHNKNKGLRRFRKPFVILALKALSFF